MNLKNNLKSLRRKKRLTQREVAEGTEITRSSYNNYESGLCEPNLCTILKLSIFFEVKIEQLIEDEL